MCDKEEVNFVAKAQNWEQRVAVEMESARIWDLQWGSLYNPNVAGGVPQDYKTRIKILEEEINKFKIPRMSTVTKTSYKQFEPYEEWHDHKRKSLERFKDDE